jgi:hypothetical protein
VIGWNQNPANSVLHLSAALTRWERIPNPMGIVRTLYRRSRDWLAPAYPDDIFRHASGNSRVTTARDAARAVFVDSSIEDANRHA